MKIWKTALVTGLLCTAIITVVVYTSCLQDACNNVNCLNGGSCNNGVCRCPTGYEGPTCSTLSVTRFIGAYAGFTSCNNTQQVIDSAFITAGSTINTVNIKLNSVYNDPTIPQKILQGYVNNNESTYSIVVTNNDSFLATSTFYERIFTVTLQSNNKLTIYSYEDNMFATASGPDTVVNKCTFVGFKD